MKFQVTAALKDEHRSQTKNPPEMSQWVDSETKDTAKAEFADKWPHWTVIRVRKRKETP